MKSVLPTCIFLVGLLALVVVVTYQKLPQRSLGTSEEAAKDGSKIVRLKGAQLTPKSFKGSDFTDFFTINKELGGTAVGWTGSVSELKKPEGAPAVVESLGGVYDYTGIISIQVYDRKTGALLSDFKNGKKEILEFVSKNRPAYFGMGVEVDLLYDQNPIAYSQYVALFKEYADSIHQASPKTLVFPIFQLEHIKGMAGGLFGKLNDSTTQHWDLLLQFPNADLIAFTSYPTLIYKEPNTIPADYYKEIFTKTTKKVAFTELGWMRTGAIKGWEASKEEQELFLKRFATQIENERVVAILWSFMYDQLAAPQPFLNMGFRANDYDPLKEKTSPAEIYWKKL